MKVYCMKFSGVKNVNVRNYEVSKKVEITEETPEVRSNKKKPGEEKETSQEISEGQLKK